MATLATLVALLSPAPLYLCALNDCLSEYAVSCVFVPDRDPELAMVRGPNGHVARARSPLQLMHDCAQGMLHQLDLLPLTSPKCVVCDTQFFAKGQHLAQLALPWCYITAVKDSRFCSVPAADSNHCSSFRGPQSQYGCSCLLRAVTEPHRAQFIPHP